MVTIAELRQELERFAKESVRAELSALGDRFDRALQQEVGKRPEFAKNTKLQGGSQLVQEKTWSAAFDDLDFPERDSTFDGVPYRLAGQAAGGSWLVRL